ncbi:MAG: D-alanine--D-alanine ligase [Clostridia bacterium]
MKKTILVIFGGNSTEHDISVITGVETLNAMPVKGYKAIPIYIKDGVWYTGNSLYEIKKFIHFAPAAATKVGLVFKELYTLGKRGKLIKIADVDCALLATHGGSGENGALQGFLEMSGVPYTSTGVKESAICMDKVVAKSALSSLGIKVVEGYEMRYPASEEKIEQLEKKLGYPIIIKPASQGSSIGITLAKSREELIKGLELAHFFDTRILAEKGLENFTEINSAAVMIGKELVLSEIEKPLTASDFLTYSDKYMGSAKGMAGGVREFPARVSRKIREKILETTKSVYEKLNLFGVVRIDYLVQGEDVYLNEINTIPGSLSHYLFPKIPHAELLKALTESAIQRGTEKVPRYVTSVLSNIGSKHK